ncbi:hypothetical protein AYK26_02910 [Euryarchaeota archaeon SM23-78]|nr:MAG: hypothetical protein AYK26_02910 [Euryarchaeota archaeon SM23-78]MBW3000393.1 hypothetical protein [Candidatus Woesearchaeota archaeon]
MSKEQSKREDSEKKFEIEVPKPPKRPVDIPEPPAPPKPRKPSRLANLFKLPKSKPKPPKPEKPVKPPKEAVKPSMPEKPVESPKEPAEEPKPVPSEKPSEPSKPSAPPKSEEPLKAEKPSKPPKPHKHHRYHSKHKKPSKPPQASEPPEPSTKIPEKKQAPEPPEQPLIKRKCDYPGCREKKDLEQCPFCSEYFCNKHLTPKNPDLSDFKKKSKLFSKKKVDGHPCADYIKQLDEEKKKEKEVLDKKMFSLLKKKLKGKEREELDRLVMSAGADKESEEEVEFDEKELEKRFKKERRRQKKPRGKSLIVSSVIILVIVISFLIYLALFYSGETTVNQTKTVMVDKTLVESVPVNLSFEKYFNDRNRYDGKKVNLTGYLENRLEGTEKVGKYVDYLVDDFNNRIVLKSLEEKHKRFIVKKEITKEVFIVTGTLNRIYSGFEMTVFEIVLTEKPKIETERVVRVEENITVPVSKPLLNLSILEKIRNVFQG